MMKISDMISQLESLQQKFGDIPVGFFDDAEMTMLEGIHPIKMADKTFCAGIFADVEEEDE